MDTHKNAKLTPRSREKLVKLVTESGWSQRQAAANPEFPVLNAHVALTIGACGRTYAATAHGSGAASNGDSVFNLAGNCLEALGDTLDFIRIANPDFPNNQQAD